MNNGQSTTFYLGSQFSAWILFLKSWIFFCGKFRFHFLWFGIWIWMETKWQVIIYTNFWVFYRESFLWYLLLANGLGTITLQINIISRDYCHSLQNLFISFGMNSWLLAYSTMYIESLTPSLYELNWKAPQWVIASKNMKLLFLMP